jgi:hypothetical protein
MVYWRPPGRRLDPEQRQAHSLPETAIIAILGQMLSRGLLPSLFTKSFHAHRWLLEETHFSLVL